MFLLLFIGILFRINESLGYVRDNNVQELYTNLIESLRRDPALLADVQFTVASRQFIDNQIDKFLNLVESYDSQPRLKRSLNKENEEGNIVDLKLYQNVSENASKDIRIFQHDSQWYAASLESSSADNKYFNLLVIKKYQTNKFVDVSKINIYNGIRIALFPLESFTVIVVAENSSSIGSDNLTNIYQFYPDESIKIVQRINATDLTDVIIWEHKQTVFMCAAHFMKRTPSNGITFEVEMPLYRWRGRHFDEIQYVKGSGTRRISAFDIGDASYVALANYRTNDGTEKVYSEILKYNPQTERYEVFQRLLTHACQHIKYFKTIFDGEEGHFIITANFAETEKSSMRHQASSIIYKFIDNYFIPFHAVQIRGVAEWESITMDNGNVILLAATSEGLQCLRYDGWRFETCTINSNGMKATDIKINSLHFERFEEKRVLVVASSDKIQSIYQVNATVKNTLKTVHDEMLTWCHRSIQRIANISTDEIVGDPKRGDVQELLDAESQRDMPEDEKLTLALNMFESQLLEIEDKLENSLQSKIEHVIDYDINATNVIFENETTLKRITTKNINNIAVKNILNNTLNINEGFKIDSRADFGFVRIEDDILPIEVNNQDGRDFVKLTNDLNLDSLEINGSAIFEKGIMVNETVDGVRVDKNVLILRDVEQKFGNFTAKKIVSGNLKTAKLNGDSVEEFREEKAIERVQQLKVKNLTIGGYLNGIHFPTLDKYSLKKHGDQNITKIYYFDHLISNDLDTKALSDRAVLADFVLTTEGSYKLNKDVRFTRDLSVNNLTAFEYLNDIQIVDGELDVLKKDSNERQYLPGVKTFENLALLDSIKLRGKIRGNDFNTMNPFVTIDSDLELTGDIEIAGDVRSEEMIKADDVVTSSRLNSLGKLQKDGLRVTETEIPVRLDFARHLNVRDVFAERINNVDPGLWLVDGAEEKQIVKGWKRMRGDLEIRGDTDVRRINGIDMEELERNVLKTNGDQVIKGKHHVKFVVADKRIITNNTIFGTIPWTDVITTSEDQVISGTTIFNTNLSSTSIFANNLQINGLINNQNINMLNDLAFRDKNLKISGFKHFRNLTINNLEIQKDLETLRSINSDVLHLPSLKNLDGLVIENIHFNKQLNGIDNTDLHGLRDGEIDLIIDGDRQFQTVTVFGEVNVGSNKINNVDLDVIVNDTVKIDEAANFDFVEFKNNVITDRITVKGHVEYLDLDNVFQNGVNSSLILSSGKTFHQDVTIQGELQIDGTFNDVDYPYLCKFTSHSNDKNLEIKGNAYFTKGPYIRQVNDNDLKKLEDTVWFFDTPTSFKENVQFTSDPQFNNITLKGLLNDVDLIDLSKQYLSKSKDQKTTADLKFEDVIFQNDVATPQLFIDGAINDIRIENFIENVLLHRPQLFENNVYLENCSPSNVNGDYLVNKLNLKEDVMRYDQMNIATGEKIFHNLVVDTLKMDKNLEVQGVDVINWARHAVLTTGAFNMEEKKIFKNATFQQGLSLPGRLNGFSFEEAAVLLRHSPQNVTGQKSFMHEIPGEMKFKALKVRGLVNNADIGELVQNQASKKRHNIFQSTLSFTNNITTKNVNFETLYQDINVTELLVNITNLDSLNNFKENYKKLLSTSDLIEASLQNQAFYLYDLKPIESLEGVLELFPISDDEIVKLVALFNENDQAVIRLLTWNEDHNRFEDMEDSSMALNSFPSHIQKVKLDNVEYLYIEEESESIQNEDNTHLGRLIKLDLQNITQFSQTAFLTKGTFHLKSFELELLHEHCLLFNDFERNMNIVCANSEDNYRLYQVIKTEKAHLVSVLTVDSLPYIIAVRAGNDSSQPRITIWRFNITSLLFEIHQIINEGEPISMSTISTPYGDYLAAAYGYARNTMDFGKIVIWKFDYETNKFLNWQTVNINTPIKIEFARLPSDQLAMYVLTEDPVSPFNVYLYEGISRFSKKLAGTAISNALNMNQFTTDKGHFIILRDYDETTIVRALFKGTRS